MGHWLVVPIALASALFFALSSALKHESAGQVPSAGGGEPGAVKAFVVATLSHKLWLGGILADVVGLSLQIVALHLGALSIVQPLLVSGLLFALLLRARRVPMARREVGWAVVLTVALGAFELIANTSRSAPALPVDAVPAAIAAAVGVVLAASCIVIGRRQRVGGRNAALMGIAIGATYAATAALLKSVTDLAMHGPLAVVTSWQLYAVVVLGAAGLMMSQLAFQAGPLTASLPAISTVDPLLSIVVGIAVYDEQVRHTPGAGFGLITLLLVLGLAVVQLTRTPAVDRPDTAATEPAQQLVGV